MSRERQRLNMLCNIGELAALLSQTSDIRDFLDSTVKLTAKHMQADVCSIYLYDENSDELVLNATQGLNPEAVGQVRMKPGEGLVGLTFEKLRPVREGRARENPRFKYFEQANEERFESFLSVPIQRGNEKVGVLVVQHEEAGYFTGKDTMALRAVAAQLAGAIESARLWMDVSEAGCELPDRTISAHLGLIKGLSAASGLAHAPATLFDRSHATLLESPEDPFIQYSQADFAQALKATAEQLNHFQAQLSERLPESAALIFAAHFMILKDPKFVGKIREHIAAGDSASLAVKKVARRYIRLFGNSNHLYMREKVADIEDLAGRILKNLYWPNHKEQGSFREKIVVAREMYPSEMIRFASEGTQGIILLRGGINSHAAILARSMGIPLVIADRPELLKLPEGTPVFLDGELGNIYIQPPPEVLARFEARTTAESEVAPVKQTMSDQTHTQDGTRVRLLANINLLGELALARELKAEGIGLYRTEFPFLIRSAFPSEEEQRQIYAQLFHEMPGREVTIRTLDVGGDKILPYADSNGGANPELGLRSIRFSLRYQELFEQQIRAVLRAGAEADAVRIMFPMISSLDEFLDAKEMVNNCLESLAQESLPHHTSPRVGMMAELASVLEIIDELTEAADFISIGTNDFVQYMLAVDRSNKGVSEYYCPHHPSVLRGLARIVRAAQAQGKPVSVCGEMAHEPEYLPFFIGIGVRTISADPRYLPDLQQQICRMELSRAEALARELLAQSTIQKSWEILERFGKRENR